MNKNETTTEKKTTKQLRAEARAAAKAVLTLGMNRDLLVIAVAEDVDGERFDGLSMRTIIAEVRAAAEALGRRIERRAYKSAGRTTFDDYVVAYNALDAARAAFDAAASAFSKDPAAWRFREMQKAAEALQLETSKERTRSIAEKMTLR